MTFAEAKKTIAKQNWHLIRLTNEGHALCIKRTDVKGNDPDLLVQWFELIDKTWWALQKTTQLTVEDIYTGLNYVLEDG